MVQSVVPAAHRPPRQTILGFRCDTPRSRLARDIANDFGCCIKRVRSAASLSPWVALSALGSANSSAALCGSAAAAAASSAAQGAAPGCVLPAVDAPPPIAQAPDVPPPAPVAAVPAAATGFSILPLLLGLAGAAAIAALILAGGGDDDDDIDVEPITQP